MLSLLTQLHTNLFFWMHSFTQKYPEYNNLIYIIAEKIDNYVIVSAIFLLLFFRYRSKNKIFYKKNISLFFEMCEIFSSIVFAWGISYLIKITTALARPALRLSEGVHPLFPYGGFDSFPSGHATLFMALGVMIFLQHKKIGSFFIFLALIIALARVIAGVHFPIDIFVGWLIGGLVSFLIFSFFKKVNFRKNMMKYLFSKK